MSAFTKGPWSYDEEGGVVTGAESVGPKDRTVAYMNASLTYGVDGANATLISAAPEMLAALKALTNAPCSYAGTHIHIFCDSHSDAIRRMREAREAIAKAEGKV